MTTDLDAALLRLLNTVLRHKGRPELNSVAPGQRLRADLGLSSLDLAELTVRIEEQFGVDVFADGVVHRWDEVCARVVQHKARRDRP
jgi:acyl carrier protein